MMSRDRVISILKDLVLFLRDNPNPSESLRNRFSAKVSLIEGLLSELSEEEKKSLDKEYRVWYDANIKGSIDPKIKTLITMMKGW